MATLIRKHSNPGNLVVDPFAGSATTGVAALTEGRRFAGCEPSPEFFPKALARLRELGPVEEAAPSAAETIEPMGTNASEPASDTCAAVDSGGATPGRPDGAGRDEAAPALPRSAEAQAPFVVLCAGTSLPQGLEIFGCVSAGRSLG